MSRIGKRSIILPAGVKAAVFADRIEIDTEDFATQNVFLQIADKLGLALDATIPPKVAAMLENFQAEQARPESRSGKAQASPAMRV